MNRSTISIKPIWRVSTLTLPLVVTLLFSGCDQGKSSLAQNSMKSAAPAISAEFTETKVLYDAAVLEGIPRINPFLTLLPIPYQEEEVIDTAGTPAPTFTDPFENVQVTGIIYRDKNPIALVSFDSDKPSKIVHKNDSVFVAGADGMTLEYKITKITRNDVSIKLNNPPAGLPPEMQGRTLEVKSLVGYRAKKETSGSTTDASGSSSVPSEIKALMPSGGAR